MESVKYGISVHFGKRAVFSWGVGLLCRKKRRNPLIVALYMMAHIQELRRTCKEDGTLSRIMAR